MLMRLTKNSFCVIINREPEKGIMVQIKKERYGRTIYT